MRDGANGNGSTRIDTERLNALIQERAEDLCRALFPGGKKKGREWKIGNVQGEPGDSLGIELEGRKAGVCHDRATGDGWGFCKLVMANRGLDFPAAARLI